jgi:hypothetical protein
MSPEVKNALKWFLYRIVPLAILFILATLLGV